MYEVEEKEKRNAHMDIFMPTFVVAFLFVTVV
jgi:uncharacterized membrane protein YadS